MLIALLAVLVLMLAAGAANAANILGVIPSPSISHQLPFRLIALELVKRGHNVTLITTDPIRKSVENYTEVDLSATYDYWRAAFDFTAMSEASPTEMIKIMPQAGKHICNIQLSSPQLKNFLKSQSNFDVIIIEKLFYLCYYGLVHKLGYPPLIGFVSLGAPSVTHETFGNPLNPSYSPDLMLGYSDHMTFWQRLYNTYFTARMHYSAYYEVGPLQQEAFKEHFGADVPSSSVYDIDRNFSLLLVNNHFSMNYPRPMVPSMIELTGLHLEKQRRPLPKDVQNFLDGAENGVIYFSLGSNVMGSAMPEEKRRAFQEAFAQLPQRVLWKWETDSQPGQPENVMTAKWLPQQDILAHPNIRLFITQGGLQSMNEATYFAVPLVGIPFIGDQRQNVVKMVQAGIGYYLEFKDVTSDYVLKVIHTVLENQSYRENMRQFSAVFREHQETSLERAVWWIEYVIRHKGAPHLRSAALDLRWWQLLLLDVIAFLLVTAIVALFLLYKATQFVIRVLRPSPKLKSS